MINEDQLQNQHTNESSLLFTVSGHKKKDDKQDTTWFGDMLFTFRTWKC